MVTSLANSLPSTPNRYGLRVACLAIILSLVVCHIVMATYWAEVALALINHGARPPAWGIVIGLIVLALFTCFLLSTLSHIALFSMLTWAWNSRMRGRWRTPAIVSTACNILVPLPAAIFVITPAWSGAHPVVAWALLAEAGAWTLAGLVFPLFVIASRAAATIHTARDQEILRVNSQRAAASRALTHSEEEHNQPAQSA